MKIRINRLSTFTMISLFSLVAFAVQAGAQGHSRNPMGTPSKLWGKTWDTHKAEIADPASGYIYDILYTFCSAADCTDGRSPSSGLIQDSAGNLYGTTVAGGANTGANGGNGGGTVFEVDNTGHETVLYSFCSAANCTDGVLPAGGLIQDSAGNLYGTTLEGGANGINPGGTGGGTVFKLIPPAQPGGNWTETVLYSFCSAPNCTDGYYPQADLIQDSAGNLYGTTTFGGAIGEVSPSGTVFSLDTTGHLTVLYSFCSVYRGGICTDGGYPTASLIQDSAGNFYSTTLEGGANSFGTVFKLDNTGHETVLYSFCSVGGGNCTDGAQPAAGLIQDSAGNLYGTTLEGGTNTGGAYGGYGVSGGGTVFKLDSTGQETVLYSFCPAPNCADGETPAAGLIQDASGNLYGTTSYGGANGAGNVDGGNPGGTVFKLDSAGQETVLYSFCPGSDCTGGARPLAGLIQDASGNLYGTAQIGGAGYYGTAFELATTGGPAVTLSPTSLKFGKTLVGKTSAAKKVTLTNSGTATLDITTIATSGDFALATVKKTKRVTACVDGGTVAAGASCEIEVTFTPLQTGTLTGDVTFTDNASNSPQQLPLTGTGKD